MSTSYRHAQTSARKWGGTPDDYIAIHEFIDGTKQTFGDVRHRALLHNTYGVWLCQQVFGVVIQVPRRNGEGSYPVVVREIAEQHIEEDLGRIPSPGDWLNHMNIAAWMGGRQHRFVGREELLNQVIKEGKS